MPLPEVAGPGTPFHAAFLEELGRADTHSLLQARRVANLTLFGVNLLQQRLVFSLTRSDVPTRKLWEAFAHTYDEVDLLEEWSEELTAVDDDTSASFHKWLTGGDRQEQLRDPQRRGPLRIAMRNEIAQRLAQKAHD